MIQRPATGLCPACRVDRALVPTTGLIAAHTVGQGVSTKFCNGNGRPPADPTKVPFRERWWVQRAKALREKGFTR